LITFLLFQSMHIFEINPIFVLTKSVLILCLFKIILVGLLCLVVYHGVGNRHTNFMIVLGCVYIILLQFAGAYSNLRVAAINPAPETAYKPAEAVKTYFWLAVLQYMLPLIIGTVAYWLFDKLGYDDRAYIDQNTIWIKR
jgi:hypothetical protein